MNLQEAIMNEDAAPESRLKQPHFDEEATLMSARPVVPLADVHQSQSRKRGWLFVSAIMLAVLVGAAGATLVYSRRVVAPGQKTEQVVVEAPPAVAQMLPGETTSPDSVAIETEAPTAEPDPKESTAVVAKRPSEPLTRVKAAPRINDRDSAAKSPVRADDSDRHYQDWEETRRRRVQERREQAIEERRQQRREARRDGRQPRRQQSRNGDESAEDLFRIREIFEGPKP